MIKLRAGHFTGDLRNAFEDFSFHYQVTKRNVFLRNGRFKVFAWHPMSWHMADVPPLSWILDSISHGDVVLDIGANRGYYSLGILSNISGARVFAFEPNPAVFKKLNANIELNANMGDIFTFPLALGEKEEDLSLFVSAADSASSFYSEHARVSGHKIVSTAKVKVTTLDSLFAQGKILAPRHIKIDTEGFEGPILRGALNVLRQYRPFLYIEIHEATPEGNNEKEIRCTLDSLGYKIFQEGKYLFCQ